MLAQIAIFIVNIIFCFLPFQLYFYIYVLIFSILMLVPILAIDLKNKYLKKFWYSLRPPYALVILTNHAVLTERVS